MAKILEKSARTAIIAAGLLVGGAVMPALAGDAVGNRLERQLYLDLSQGAQDAAPKTVQAEK